MSSLYTTKIHLIADPCRQPYSPTTTGRPHSRIRLDVMYTNAHAAILLVQHLKVVGVRLTAAQRAARDPRAQPFDGTVRLGTGQQLPRPADLVGRRYTCVSTWYVVSSTWFVISSSFGVGEFSR